MIRSIENNVYHGTDTPVDAAVPAAPEPAVKARSESQREASRRNGRKSAGPRTTAGKRRSRRNAMKHGLRAEKIAPPDDPRRLNRDFKRAYKALCDEFGVTTYSQQRVAAELARTYLRLDFADRLMDIVEQPPSHRDKALVENESNRRRSKRNERLAGELLAALKSGEPPAFKYKDADRLADLVAESAETVEEDMNEEAVEELASLEEAEAAGELEGFQDYELEELRQLDAQARLIKPRRRQLRDRERLAATFRGDRKVVKAEVKVLIALVTDIRDTARSKAIGDPINIKRLALGEENHLRWLVANPRVLTDLDAYHARLSRSANRLADRLRSLCE